MRLELAGADDHEAVVALANLAYRGTGATRSWTVEAYLAGDRTTLAMLRADIAAKPGACLLVHRDDGGIVRGSVWLEPQADGAWHLGLLAIDPALQNGGRGRALLASAEDFARARGAVRIGLSVINVRDTLLAWYERRGYRRTGATEPFPYGDDRFGTPLRDDLCFVLLEKRL